VVKAACVAPPSRSTVAITGTSVGIHHAESSRAGALRSSSTQSPTTDADVARAIVPRRTSTHVVGGASTGQGPQISGRIERGGYAGQRRRRRGGGRRIRPRTECASQAEGRTEEEAEDIDQPFDEEEDTGTRMQRAPRATQVKFPTEEEF
jgi:hypothetical protein